jgi:hypothetical protein
MTDESALKIAKNVDERGAWYSITFDPRTLSPLAKVIASAGRGVDGYAAEAVLVRLSEIGEPAWADELIFDSEVDACTVRCPRKAPLVHLARRLDKRLAEPARLRRLVKSLPEE